MRPYPDTVWHLCRLMYFLKICLFCGRNVFNTTHHETGFSHSKTADIASVSADVLAKPINPSVPLLFINMTIINLLVAFYGAFFMSFYYQTQCYLGDCQVSIEIKTIGNSTDISMPGFGDPVRNLYKP